MMLLIVDDNQAFRRMITRVVGDLADEIRECADGAQALAAYRQFHPDLVLMDIEMQGMDGITATREITTAFPEARVIIVTGHNDEPLCAAAREAGACGYVLKENLLTIREMIGTPPHNYRPGTG
jgi:two-component system response regulator DegU